jgi:hypothetical protein
LRGGMYVNSDSKMVIIKFLAEWTLGVRPLTFATIYLHLPP